MSHGPCNAHRCLHAFRRRGHKRDQRHGSDATTEARLPEEIIGSTVSGTVCVREVYHASVRPDRQLTLALATFLPRAQKALCAWGQFMEARHEAPPASRLRCFHVHQATLHIAPQALSEETCKRRARRGAQHRVGTKGRVPVSRWSLSQCARDRGGSVELVASLRVLAYGLRHALGAISDATKKQWSDLCKVLCSEMLLLA